MCILYYYMCVCVVRHATAACTHAHPYTRVHTRAHAPTFGAVLVQVLELVGSDRPLLTGDSQTGRRRVCGMCRHRPDRLCRFAPGSRQPACTRVIYMCVYVCVSMCLCVYVRAARRDTAPVLAPPCYLHCCCSSSKTGGPFCARECALHIA